jgi:hypothetical protein
MKTSAESSLERGADPPRVASRHELLRDALAAGAAISVAGIAVQTLPLAAADNASPRDVRALNFLLGLEELQAAFYERAIADGQLDGDLLQFATTAGPHERDHVAAIRRRLGDAAQPAPTFDFGDAIGRDRFGKTAVELEELALAAQSGQGPELSKGALALIVRIASVDARHAAWIRDAVGVLPAPFAADPARTAAEVATAVKGTGFAK